MTKNKRPNPLFVILLLFEDMIKNQITESDYIGYLNRISVEYLGKNEMEIYNYIVGLSKLGSNIEQQQVKSIVFHLLELEGKNATEIF